ncbi:MAG: D-glycero-beta-D-manno-heptose 1-phosphate adenylyltransferase [Planctomycetaceae bacterium]|nr:D-glycero-beta-D-manno-heptose 1-phosphate adenylyltransferase [Planctomycetaceae bacterium]
MDRLVSILERFGRPRVALVGDFMLDRYIYGNVDRLSPEAPVPVLNVGRREVHPGGAASVAAAMLALDAEVCCVGVIGKDSHGEELVRLLGEADTMSLMRLYDRCTTVKCRYVGLAQHRHAQQMLRVDEEQAGELPEEVGNRLVAALRGVVQGCKVVALQDYDKGVLTDTTAPEFINVARKAGADVVVDPARIRSYRRYLGATLLTPNRYEAELASGVTITDEESMARAAREIIREAEAQAVIITLDREGAFLFTREGVARRIATKPRSVYDVTGAGDEVLAMMAVAIANRCNLTDAVELANVAGGLEVERFGVVPITRDEVLAELHKMIGLRGSKVLARRSLLHELARLRQGGHTIVFTNGCFDLLHMGHVRYLAQARTMGTALVVAINSDESVQRLKGPSRPIIPAAERAEMLGALECVDYVTIFDEDTPETLLELIKPDILVKGGTTAVIVGQDIVENYGGRVLTLQQVEGLSTTAIIGRIMEQSGGQA